MSQPARPATLRTLAESDPEIAAAIAHEGERQELGIELIASENFVTTAIMEAAGSVMTNKYAEGYPGKRYYGGCEYVDVAESLAIERARALFGAEHANVQPHSGAQANMAVFLAVLSPGDTILGMNLAHGGHLTHGHPLNFSGRFYKVVPYGVRQEDERLDYDEMERLAMEHKPRLIIAGASAYPRTIDFARIGAIARAAGSMLMVDMAHISGLVAGGVHPSPVPHADFVTTTTHKTLRGPRSGLILCRSTYAKDIDRAVFPGVQGGPLMHVVAAKAVCFREALDPSFAEYQRQVVRNAQQLAATLSADGFRIVSGGTDNHIVLLDVRLFEGPHRQGGREGPRRCGDHGEQERHSLRPEPADGGLGHQARHAGHDDARHARARDGADWPPHFARAGGPRLGRRARTGEG